MVDFASRSGNRTFKNNEQYGSNDQRRARRFPIQQAVHYECMGPMVNLKGTGTTVDFSSTGIAFTTEHRLPVGSLIEIAVDWPAKLGGDCALKFVAFGCVVRSDDDRAAVKTHKYEFRTRGKRPVEGPR